MPLSSNDQRSLSSSSTAQLPKSLLSPGNIPVPEDNEVNLGNEDLDEGLQQEATASAPLIPPGPPSSYASMAAKTVANIKRLQGNVLSLNISSPSAFSPSFSAISNGENNVSTITVVADNCLVQHQPLVTKPSIGASTSNTPLQPPEEIDIKSDIGAAGPLTIQQVLSPVHEALKDFSRMTTTPSPPSSPTPSKAAFSFNALVTVDPNWQCSKKSVRDRNILMFNNSLMADIYFLVGPDNVTGVPSISSNSSQLSHKIPAHKYILATGSSVFYAMLYGGLSTTDTSKDVIEVPDVEYGAFMTMLKYLYYDEIALTPDNVLSTLYCAKKYIIPHLADACVRFLETSLTARNACLLLSQAILFGETALMERSWEVIDAQAELALTSEGFTDIDYSTLSNIISRETLNCKETVVFQAAQSWASAECKRRETEDNPVNRRDILGNIMNNIRFTAMNVQDFADHVATSGILSLQETNDIFLYFTARNKPKVVYPTKPRSGLKAQFCRRFQSSAYRSNQWRYRGRCDAIQFCVDRRIFIVGFGLYGSSSGSSDYVARIQLKLTSPPSGSSFPRASRRSGSCWSHLLAENVQKFYSDGSSNTFHVFFDQPVQIEPDHFYTALAVLEGAELSYFGQEGMSEVTVGPVTFQFQGSCESTNGTGIQGGQIPELIFYGPQGEVNQELKMPKSCTLLAPSRPPSALTEDDPIAPTPDSSSSK